MYKIEGGNMGYDLIVEFEVEGKLPRKSNQRQLVRAGRGKNARPMIIKSKEAREYIKKFRDSVPEEFHDIELGDLDTDLRLDVIVWYRDRRPDLSIELLKDAIEDAGVIKNDRYIREEHIYGFVDKENPRVKIRLYFVPSERELPF
jgi:Holliday junction resolvase RusA-like endonuclease